MAAQNNALSSKAPERKAARYQMTDPVSVRDADNEHIGRVAIGKSTRDTALVFDTGTAQTGIPLFVLAQAIASCKVLTPEAIVGVYVEAGKLDRLARAVEKAVKDAGKEAGA